MPHSIAVPATSPSPCAACPSPRLSSAPGTATGRYSVEPVTSSLQSMLPPPTARGGIVEYSPGSSQATPVTPRNGAIATVWPQLLVAVPAAASTSHSSQDGGLSCSPRRRVSGVSLAADTVQPQSAGCSAANRTASTSPG